METRRKAARFLIGAIGATFLVLACTRSAQQTNFLGKACTGAADCPAELLCVAEACWERCGPGGTCESGSSCQLGACVPGGGGDPGTAVEAGTPQGPPDTSVGTFDSTPPGPTVDGQLVLASFPTSTGSVLSGDDLRTAYMKETRDVFNVATTTLVAVPYAGSPADVYTFPQGEAKVMGGLTMNGSFYFNTMAGSGSISRVDLGSGARTTIANDVGRGPAQVGTKLAYNEQSTGKLRLYDTSTNTLDPTLYGPAAASRGDELFVSLQANQITWLSPNNATSSIDVYQATLGAAGTKLARVFPGTGNFTAFAALGAKGLLILGSGAGPTAYTVKLDDNSALAPSGAGANNNVASSDGYLFFVEETAPTPGPATQTPPKLTRLDVNGTRTVFGTAESAEGLFTTTGFVYVGIGGGTAGSLSLYKWAKP